MLTFWIIAGLFILLAFWFVLPALLQQPETREKDQRRAANVLIYKDQYRELEADFKNGLIGEEQCQQERAELERRLLEDVNAAHSESASSSSSATKKFAYSVAAFIPIGAIALYFVVGNPKATTTPTAPAAIPADADQQAGMMSQQQIAANVDKLAERLKQNPNDPQGWLMLARSYVMLERFSDAASAYERATALNANDAEVWADYAEASAMANGQRLSGKPTEAINRALQIDPKNQKALDLAGSAAFQAGDYQKAIEYWQKLLSLLPAGSEELRTISDQIAKAKQLAGDKDSR
jgi:cytochrome c-type biogenesis protein CcmH